MFKDTFINAIHERKILTVTFDAKEKGIITRKCIPYDFGPSSRAKDKSDRYHFHDLNSPEGEHNLSILPEQLVDLQITQDQFDPADYVKWEPKWYVQRNWGKYS